MPLLDRTLHSEEIRPTGTYHTVVGSIVLLAAILVLVQLFVGLRGVQAVAALVVILVLAWALRRTMLDPFWLVFGLVLEETFPYLNFLPFDPNSRWWIRYPLLLSLCVPAIPAAWRSGILKRGVVLGYVAFLGWGVVSLAYSENPRLSAGRLLPNVILFCGLSLIASKIRQSDDIRLLLERFLLACSVLVALNMLAWILPAHVSLEDDTNATGFFNWIRDANGMVRFCGFFGQPNAIGGLTTSTCAAALMTWNFTRNWHRVLLAAVIGCSVFLALIADSRSSSIGLAVGIAAFTVWKYRLRGFLACLAVLILLAGIYSALGSGERTYVNRDVDTFTGRTTLWSFELRKLAERPLVGYGYDIEGGIFDDPRFPDWNLTEGTLVELHNSYLGIAIDLGIPALLSWLFILLSPWISLFRSSSDPWGLKPMFFLVVVPAMLVGAVESGLAEPRYTGGLLLFLCWLLAERYRVAIRVGQASQRFDFRDSSSAVNWQRLFAT